MPPPRRRGARCRCGRRGFLWRRALAPPRGRLCARRRTARRALVPTAAVRRARAPRPRSSRGGGRRPCRTAAVRAQPAETSASMTSRAPPRSILRHAIRRPERAGERERPIRAPDLAPLHAPMQESTAMNVVVTGGLGFIGLALARRLAARNDVESLTLFDVAAPLAGLSPPAGADVVVGDVCDAAALRPLLDRPDVVVFHLASIVSAGGERDFDLAMRVNLDGGRNVFEACRATGTMPRVVFASTLAVFGGAAMPETVNDATRPTPQTTYGATKAACELLLNDYSRKGVLDGRAARLPTVIIRPGAPNLAASSFASA